jgi:hypothetical protein
MLAHPAEFHGYPLTATGQSKETFCFSPSANLYGLMSPVHDALRFAPADATQRRDLLMAAAAETVRYSRSTYDR